MKTKLILAIFLLLTTTFAQANEQMLLGIQTMTKKMTNAGLEGMVTYEIQKCKFDFQGIVVEEIPADALGLKKLLVSVMATKKIDGDCLGPVGPASTTIVISPVKFDHKLIPNQPEGYNPHGFVCQTGWINCNQMVGETENKYCSDDYPDWAERNCGSAPLIAR